MSSLSHLLMGGGLAAAGVFAWGAVAPSAQLFGPTLRRTGDHSTVALTFDDGPDPAITPALLDLLDRFDVHASFFEIGRKVRAFPALVREAFRRGHTIGNHTDTHPRLTFLSPSHIREQLARCNDSLVASAGCEIRWMRPPYGYRGPQLASTVRSENKNTRIVMWSISANDWKSPAEGIIARLRRVRGGDIVLLHDGDHRALEGDRRNTLKALEYWLPRWKDSGIGLLSLDELAQKGFTG